VYVLNAVTCVYGIRNTFREYIMLMSTVLQVAWEVLDSIMFLDTNIARFWSLTLSAGTRHSQKGFLLLSLQRARLTIRFLPEA
jgi:hypothetical protein